MRSWIVRVAAALLVAGLLVLIVTALVESDADRIEKLVEEMRQAALRRDVEGVLAGVAEDATYAGRGPPALRRAVAQMEHWPPRRVAVSLEEIEVDGDRATATAEVLYEAEGWPRAVPLVVRLGFARRDGEWRLVSADPR